MTKQTKLHVHPANQSFLCPHEENLDPQLPTERTAKTLIRLGGCTCYFVGFDTRWLIFTFPRPSPIDAMGRL